jgi:hypothetical protein
VRLSQFFVFFLIVFTLSFSFFVGHLLVTEEAAKFIRDAKNHQNISYNAGSFTELHGERGDDSVCLLECLSSSESNLLSSLQFRLQE